MDNNYKKIKRVIYDSDSKFAGTCFFVDKNIAITAGHVVKNKENLKVSVDDKNEKTIDVLETKLCKDNDIAILVLAEEIQECFELNISDVYQDEKWEAFGYPSTKKVNGERIKGTVSIADTEEHSLYDIDFRLDPPANLKDYRGLSGAPVIIEGRVKAIIKYKPDGNTLGGVKLSRCEKFLRDNGIKFINKKSEALELFSRIRSASRKYYNALTSTTGRFSTLDLTDIIMPRIEFSGNEYFLINGIEKAWGLQCKHLIITGSGGSGKTISLIEIWKYYQQGRFMYPIPIYISLNEYNKYNSAENFIFYKIAQNYLGKKELGKEDFETIYKMLSQPTYEGDKFIPSFIILLDGFNEITVDEENLKLLIGNLNYLNEHAHGVQIIITSRYERLPAMLSNFFNNALLSRLNDQEISEYLNKREINFPDTLELKNLIKNPFMLKIYSQSCNIVERFKNDNIYNFKSPVNTSGELIWNYIQAEIVKIDGNEFLGRLKNSYRFIFLYMLPAIGYSMEKNGKYYYSEFELMEIVQKICDEFREKKYYKIFGLKLSDLSLGENEEDKYDNAIEKVKTVHEKLRFLFMEDSNYRLVHQNFRDFFAAMYILNDIQRALLFGCNAVTLEDGTISKYVRQYIGEIEKEYTNSFNLVNIKDSRPQYLETRIEKILNFYRNKFDEASQAPVRNILMILRDSRKDFIGLNLSELNLSGYNMKNIICCKEYEGSIISGNFQNALVDDDTFFSKGHEGQITAIKYNLDCTKILAGSIDGIIKEWDCKTGKCIHTYIGHKDAIKFIEYIENEQKIISASMDYAVKEWDSENEECLITYKEHQGFITCGELSPDYTRFVTASEDSTIKEWDISSMKCIGTYVGHTGIVMGVKYSKDGDRIISCSDQGEIIEWNAKDREIENQYEEHCGFIFSIQYSHDGNKILSGGSDGLILEFDRNRKICKEIKYEYPSYVKNVFYSLDSSRVLCTITDGRSFEVNKATGEIYKFFARTEESNEYEGRYEIEDESNIAKYSNNDKYIVVGFNDGFIRLFDGNTKKIMRLLMGEKDIIDIIFSNNNEKLLVTYRSGTMMEFDIETGEILQSYLSEKNGIIKVEVVGKDEIYVLLETGLMAKWSLSKDKLIKKFTDISGIKNIVAIKKLGIIIIVTSQEIYEMKIDTYEIIYSNKFDGIICDFHYFNGGKKLAVAYKNYGIRKCFVAEIDRLKKKEINKFRVPEEYFKCLLYDEEFQDLIFIIKRYESRGKDKICILEKYSAKTKALVANICAEDIEVTSFYDSNDNKNIIAFIKNELSRDCDDSLLTGIKIINGMDRSRLVDYCEKQSKILILQRLHSAFVEERSYDDFKSLNKYNEKRIIYKDAKYLNDGKEIVSVSNTGEINVWSTDNNKCIKKLANISSLCINGCLFSNLHKDSKLTKEHKEMLRQNGSII